jgi:uncharacterized protein YjbJ (UPF0337 family)
MSGETDKISGRVKQAAGALIGDESLEREGERDESAGKLKDGVDTVKDKVDDGIDKIKDALN